MNILGKPPMMTHVFENKEGKQLLLQGGPETMVSI
jgi:hypothetical protein